jgi:hypothetical protein
VYGAGALLVGGLLHLAVERPFLRLRERVARKETPQGGA